MRFVHPWLLLLLPVVPLLGLAWFWLARRSSLNLARLVSPALQARLMPARAALRQPLQLALTIAGLFLLVIAAARPQWGKAEQQVISRGRNLVIALDVSRSMLARDVHPNRLERARVDIMDLIGELKGDRAALLAFRRRGILLCPLTTDYAFLRQALDGITIDSAPRGETDLADAIRKSLDAFKPVPEDDNAILLITDGEDLAGAAIDAAREARRRGVPIFTVGIGDPSGATIPDEQGTGNVSYHGETVRTRLVESSLAAIARESGGRYVPLGTAGTVQTTLGSIFRQHLRQIQEREQRERLESRAVERYQWFLLPALILLLAAATLSRGRLAARPPARVPLRAALTLCACLGAWSAQAGATSSTPATNRTETGRALARQAQSSYRLGRYDEAASAYETAARGSDGEDAQIDLYNAALAHHRGHQDDQAMPLLESLTHGSMVGDRATELLGLAAFGQAASTNGAGAEEAKAALTEEAGRAFQQALVTRADDARRRRNLARVQNQLPVLRDNARIARLLAQYGKTPPEQLAADQLREQRALLVEAPQAFTNEAAEEIRRLEALGDRQERNADLLVPLKQAILSAPSLTNEEQRAEINRAVELTRDAMTGAAGKLRDLDPTACSDVAHAEAPTYTFWYSLALPPPLIDEDILLQSNVITRASEPVVPFRPDQPEALHLTHLFQDRFPAWADGIAKAAQSDTNAPTLSPKDRREIEQLTTETIPLQEQALRETGTALLERQRHALRNLLRIRELLPKQKQKQKQNQQQQQKQKQQPRQQPQEQPKPEPQPQEQKQEPEEQPKPEQKPPPDVQNLLQRAIQREKEHEAEKRQQMEHIPMLPNERDW